MQSQDSILYRILNSKQLMSFSFKDSTNQPFKSTKKSFRIGNHTNIPSMDLEIIKFPLDIINGSYLSGIKRGY